MTTTMILVCQAGIGSIYVENIAEMVARHGCYRVAALSQCVHYVYGISQANIVHMPA
jgi:hypothetical protein